MDQAAAGNANPYANYAIAGVSPTCPCLCAHLPACVCECLHSHRPLCVTRVADSDSSDDESSTSEVGDNPDWSHDDTE
jgi:hypothetical protein